MGLPTKSPLQNGGEEKPTPSEKIVGKHPVKLVEIPPGTELVIFKKEFSTELIQQRSELETEVSKLGPITSQEDVQRANVVLKRSSTFMNRVDTVRKEMGSHVKGLLDDLLITQRSFLHNLASEVEEKNNAILVFQRAEKKRIAEEEESLRKKQLAEEKAARDEADRKGRIQNYILEYENNVLRKINESDINTIDTNIKVFEAFKLTTETYMEFLPQAQAMQIECRAKFQKRKADLQQLAELEAKNKEAADKLRLEQAQAAQASEAEQQKKAEAVQQEISEQLESDVSNITMNAEFKSSMQPKLSNVMVRWVFDEDKVDISKLPIEYHTYDKKKIQEAIKTGARNIAGVTIREEISNVKK